MKNFKIPGAESCRTLIRDLRTGHAGWIVRTSLSLVCAMAILSIMMVWLGLLESTGRRVTDSHIAITAGISSAVFCGSLALFWWSFRRFQTVLKSIFSIVTIWAIVTPAAFIIEAAMQRGEEFFIAAIIFLGIAASIAAIVLIMYNRFRAAPLARAIVHLSMNCPECGYSLMGLRVCRCPECGTEYTADELMQALGQGQVKILDSDKTLEPAQQIEADSTPIALPEPDPV